MNNAASTKQSKAAQPAKSTNINKIPKQRQTRQKKVKAISSRCQFFSSSFSTLTLFPQIGQNSMLSRIGLLQKSQTRMRILYLPAGLLELRLAYHYLCPSPSRIIHSLGRVSIPALLPSVGPVVRSRHQSHCCC